MFDDGLLRSPTRLGFLPMKPTLRSLVLVSNNARIGRPKRKINGMEEVTKADQLKARLFDEFDKAPEWKLATVLGKEGLAAFARELAALHRPIEFDWAAKFGLSQAPAAAPAATRPSNATRPDGRTRPWFVKFDGPCSRCGRTLVKGIEAVWSSRQRRMFCLECARSLSD